MREKISHFEKQVCQKSNMNTFYGLIKQMVKTKSERDETVNSIAES